MGIASASRPPTRIIFRRLMWVSSKNGRGGKGRPPQRPQRPVTLSVVRNHDDSGQNQMLIQGLRRAMRGSEPLDFLAIVSGLLEVTDPRRRSPFARGDEQPTADELVESLIGTSFAETTAALTAIRALSGDELLAARIGRELATRRHPLPDWLAGLNQARIEPEVWFVTHVLGDGDDYLVGVTLPSGHSLSALVYIDHNMGTVVKDAFIVPQPLGELTGVMAQTMSDVDQTMSLVDPALARAAIEKSIEHGARTFPPLESDSWPMCRPIVEWMLRMLPAGGVVPQRREWTDGERNALAATFFGSPFAAGLDDRDNHDLLDRVLWFGIDYGPGDPLRWSPVNVEILLSDWFPRKILAEPDFLSQLPGLLRAFIRFSHSERGIRPSLTAQTLAAVDLWEPAFQRTIRSSRLQGRAALIAGMLEPADDDDLDYEEVMLEGLDEAVGGRAQLLALTDAPLPNEAFEWTGVADDIRPVIGEILEACDRVADEILDLEHRTAMRRFLSRAAVGDPAIFRRKASPQRGAAAVAWVIARANDTVGGYWSGLTVQDLLASLGVSGSVSQRAEPLLRANGVNPHRLYGSMKLGAADLLTSRKRASIIQQRDRYLGDYGEGTI